MRDSETNVGVLGLMRSILIASFVGMLLSHNLTFSLTQTHMNDGSIMRDSRLSGITTRSLELIETNVENPIIAIGSSMTLKALDGKCVTDQLNGRAVVHNLAHVNSMPWNDMIHIPRIVSLNPEIVLIEIGPNILANLTSEKKMEYSQLRYKTDTANQDGSDNGEWYELVDPRMHEYIALDDITRMKFRQEYVVDSVEEKWSRLIFDESSARKDWSYGWVPEDDDVDAWLNYLQTPPFPSDRNGFEGMNQEEREEYNMTKMSGAASYNPQIDSYGQRVLEYEISTLLENGIEVILVVLPQHFDSISSVPDGKWDKLNQSIEGFEKADGVTTFNQLWATGWEYDHFFDRNHLDDEGRIEFCNRLAPVIDQVLLSSD